MSQESAHTKHPFSVKAFFAESARRGKASFNNALYSAAAWGTRSAIEDFHVPVPNPEQVSQGLGIAAAGFGVLSAAALFGMYLNLYKKGDGH